MIAFEHYARVYNNILWAYEGLAHEYLVMLAWARQEVTRLHPQLNITICGSQQGLAWIAGEENVITDRLDRYRWSAVKVFKTSPVPPHPVQHFLENIKLTSNLRRPCRGLVAVVTRGNFPAPPLTDKQIQVALQKVKDMGCEAYIIHDPNDPHVVQNTVAVFGTECPALWQAAREGKQVAMPATCPGYTFLKTLRPDMDVLLD